MSSSNEKTELISRVETEVKFVVPDPTTFAALRELTGLGDFQFKPVGTKSVTDRYFDVVDRRLLQAGFACRIREAGGQQTLTLKSLTPPENNVHRRREIELEVPAEQPQSWPESLAKKLVLEIAGAAPLRPLFTIHQTRHSYVLLRHDQPVIELSLDEVSFSHTGQVDIYELEAELNEAGSEADLARLSEVLQTEWELQPQSQSKFERALAYQNRQEQGLAKLSPPERAVLEQIADGDDKLLARRAMIILMSDADNPISNIAKEVELSVQTVRQWQKAFRAKRLDIFPKRLPAMHQAALPGQPSEQSIEAEAAKPRKAKKGKAKKAKQAGLLPTRKRSGLKPTDTLAEAGRKVLRFHLARLLKHEPGSRAGDDIEALHDMRVASRRLRSALDIFEPGFSKKAIKPLQKGLKATGQALGAVRDLDVFIEGVQRYQQSLPKEQQAGLQPLLAAWQAKREAAREEMLAYLNSRAYQEFKKYFLKFVKSEGLGAKTIADEVPPAPQQVRHVAPGLIYAAYAQVRAFEPGLDSATLETLHELRKACKALRYTLEYLQEILGKEKKGVIEAIKALQDHLGALNDARVAAGLLHEFLAEWEQHQLHLPLAERQSPAEIMAYLNEQVKKQHSLLTSFPQAWGQFNRPDFRRKLARAVAAA
jgi:CHAD domain-containing protein/adenylate cyclase class IV